MAFPVNPVTGQLYTDVKGITYIFNNGAWLLQSAGSGLVGGDAAMIPMVAASLNAIGQQVSFNTVGAVLLGNGVSFSGTNITLAPGRWFLSSQVYLEPFTNTSGVIQFAWFRDGVEIPNSRDLNVPYTTTGAGSFVAQAHATVDLTAPAVFTLRVVSIAGTVSLQALNISRVNIQKINAAAVGSFSPATELAAGGPGFVPAPLAGENKLFLRGDGEWVAPDPVVFSSTTVYQPGERALYNGVEVLRTAPTGSGLFTWASWRPVEVELNRWKGVWANSTSYAAGDVVVESSANEIMYVATSGHTSAASGSFGVNVRTSGGANVTRWSPFVTETLNAVGAGNFIGATAAVAGRSGFVPEPISGQQLHVLRGSGIWEAPDSLLNVTLYSGTTTTHTFNTRTRRIVVEVQGAGGGGGGATSNTAGQMAFAGGGGAGGYFRGFSTMAALGNPTTASIVAPNGGAGGNGNQAGSAGGTARLTINGTERVTANPGGGGGGNSGGNGAGGSTAGGSGGTASWNTFTTIAALTGGNGADGLGWAHATADQMFGISGDGASTLLGWGGFGRKGRQQALNGFDARGYGSGGGGGYTSNAGGAVLGGIGAPAAIIIYEFS